MSKLKSLKPFIPAYSFAVLILIGSSIPTHKLHQEILPSDFIIHFVAFILLTILLSIGYVKTGQSKTWWAKAALISLFVGVLVEVIQIFIPYRTFSTRDLGVDVVGIIAALVFFALLKKKCDGSIFFHKNRTIPLFLL